MIKAIKRKMFYCEMIETRLPKKAALSNDLKQYIGCKSAFALGSGRMAIEKTIKAMGLTKKDEIILPAYMCENVVQMLSKKMTVRLVDVDKKTLCMKPSLLKKEIAEKTKAIMPVHMYGQSYDVTGVKKIAKNGVLVIEDCAHSLGAVIRGRKTGTFGDASIFSFAKTTAWPRGGALCVNNAKIKAAPEKRTAGGRYAKYEKMFDAFGPSSVCTSLLLEKASARKTVNYYFSSLSGFEERVLSAQLRDADENVEKTIMNFSAIKRAVKNSNIEIRVSAKGKENIFTRIPLIIEDHNIREEALNRLNEIGVNTTMAYQTNEKYTGQKKDEFPVSNEIERSIVPLYVPPCFTSDDVSDVINVLEGLK